MTSPAIKLAKELCICAVVDGRIVPAMPSEGLFIRQLERFYAKAQAAALRDLKDAFMAGDPRPMNCYVREVQRRIDELERGA